MKHAFFVQFYRCKPVIIKQVSSYIVRCLLINFEILLFDYSSLGIMSIADFEENHH